RGGTETQQKGNTTTVRPVSGTAGGPGGKPGDEDELKLTKIIFAGRMYANNKTHTATFTDSVETAHVPSDNPNAEPNIDRLPEGGFYLRCDKLEVYSRENPTGSGPRSQEMRSYGHIFFRSQDAYGTAATVTYDESKDQVIFLGDEAG